MGALTFFVIAGEPSGDRLGAALMAGLQTLSPGARFDGVGGPLMQAQGMTSLFAMDELSIMGLVEVLPKYLHLKRRIAQVAAAVLASDARALITIDSPDFCLRVAALVKAKRPDFEVIHYVAPSVWAWRPGRAAKMAKVVDHVLALLPFEPPLMQAAGMTSEFVGHPVVSEPLGHRQTGDGPLLLVLPGSRRGEVSRLCPVFGAVLSKVKAAHPLARVALPTLAHLVDQVRDLTAQWPIAPQIITDPAAKLQAFASADVALAASGTVSLELAANGVPMVIAYKMNPVSFWAMRQLALTDTVTLVNLVSDTRVVPEFLGPDCRADKIAPAVLDALANPEAQRAAMDLTMQRLGRGGEAPGLRAARSVLAALQ